jgi:hypothetical protein
MFTVSNADLLKAEEQWKQAKERERKKRRRKRIEY